ncbi:MAG: hypothetical protein R2764_00640 [Bacteroidales bacterium]
MNHKANCPEKWWGISHPFIVKKSIQITKQALRDSDSIGSTNTLDSDLSGGQLDAFKHSYWMSLLVRDIKERKALKLGIAHEKGNYKSFKKRIGKGEKTTHDKPGSDMDLWNNRIGIEIGKTHKKDSRIILQQAVIDSIKAGKMRILYKNKSGQYLNCEGELIPQDSLSGKWENEKCLVPSNFIQEKQSPPN